MKIGIMAASRDLLESEMEIEEVIEYLLLEDTSYQFVMGPNETGVLRTIKDKIREEHRSLTAVGVRKTSSLFETRASKKIEVENVCDRTERLFDESDVVIFFPGGIGTRAELYSMIDIKMETDTKKKLILYNFHQLFSSLLEDIDKMIERNLIEDTFYQQNYITVVETKEELLEEIRKEDDKNE